MLEHFKQYARDYLAEIERPEKTTPEVIRIIQESLDGRNLGLAGAAKKMGMSVRTPQGRLKGEGTVFSKLLQHTRERLVKKYLRKNHMVEDITNLLGFTEAGVFRKAFKKWSGQTPGEYRHSVSAVQETPTLMTTRV